MPRKRRSQAEWAGICREFKAGGETAEVFARRRGLKRSTLLWWMSRLHRQDTPPEPSSGFVEVVSALPNAVPRAVVRVGEVAVECFDGMPPAAWIAELAGRC